jgi:hypothetical protein
MKHDNKFVSVDRQPPKKYDTQVISADKHKKKWDAYVISDKKNISITVNSVSGLFDRCLHVSSMNSPKKSN